ncbi:MAG: hypothetical protein PHI94_07005, partial [Eubacteriaceae bacterium]|nr:hypothetical protein [Eubacteriaceae bacterium]
RTGDVIVSNLESFSSLKSGLSKEQYDKLVNYSGDFIILHNHPGGGRFSSTDIISSFNKELNCVGNVAVGSSGEVHAIMNFDKRFDVDAIFKEAYNELKRTMP